MSQRRTAPSSLPEGSGLGRVGLSLQETARKLCNVKFRRQLLACSIATITMSLAGTVYGWTKTSLVHLTTGSGDVPLTLTKDESSWVVSLTVVGSMIGSLLAAQLADRSGRKYCLLVCSTMFTIGWFIIYFATSAPMLYLAGVTLGIGVGIAHTINPMFVSEVADIKYRGSLCVLIAANANSGTLLSYALAIWLTYKSQLLFLAGISAISILPISRFPETPYFLVAKGQKEQARLSIAYYKDIEDPHKVKIEQRALRDQVTYELQQQFGDELDQQSGSDLPSQSRREAHSDSFWEVVDTEPMSDLNLSSSSDSPSQSTSVIHTEVTCEVHQEPTDELRLQSTREVHSQSTSELHLPTASEIHRSPAGEIHRPSTSEIPRLSASELHRPSTCEIQGPSTSQIHQQTTCEIQGSSTSQIHRPSASAVHQPSTSEIHLQSTCEIQGPSTSQMHRPSTSQILLQTRGELHSQARSDLRTQSNVDSRASTDIPETYIGVTKYTCLTKLRALLQRSNRKALFIMLGLIMAQQLSGNSTATQYLEELIDRKTAFIDLHGAMILAHVVPHVCGYSMTVIVAYFGRRTLLLLSTIGSCISLLLLAGYLFLDLHKFVNPTTSILPVSFLSWYQLLFQVGLGTLPNVFLCDLFPTKLKGFVGATVVIFDGIIGFTASKLNQVITDNLERHAIFFFFATSCILAFLLVFIWVPETKGKTYNETETLLVGENLNSLNEEVRSDEIDIHRI